MVQLILQKWLVVLLLIIAGFVAILGTQQLVHQDEGVFLTIGQAMSQGSLPYVDLFDHKPPGIYFVAMLLELVKPTDFELVRTSMLGVALIASVVMYWLLRRFSRPWLAAAGVGMFIVMAYWYQGGFFITEPWMILFVLLSYALLLVGIGSRFSWQWMLSGIFMGLALLFKQVAILNVLAVGVFFYGISRNGDMVWLRKKILCWVLGLFSVLLLVIGSILYSNMWGSFWYSVVWFNVFEYIRYPLLSVVFEWPRLLQPGIVLWALSLISLFFIKTDKPVLLLVKISWIVTLPILFSRPYHQYWLQLLPMAIILTIALLTELPRVRSLVILSMILVGMTYIWMTWYQVLPQRNSQIDPYLALRDCSRITDTWGYYFSDCKPPKYFYEPKQFHLSEQ